MREDLEDEISDHNELKSSPLSFSPDQGLLEQVKEVVRPLTDGGGFQLKSLIYCDNYQDGNNIKLTSPAMEIDFGHNLRLTKYISVYFKVRPLKESFSAEPLFSARKIPITFHECGPRPDMSDHARMKTYNSTNIIALLLWETGFIEELNRLCNEIRANLPAIQNAFAPENLDETLRLYAIECQKKRPASESSFSSTRWRGDTCAGRERGEFKDNRGKIERIFEALKPINRLYDHKTIYYDIVHDRFAIEALPSNSEGCDIFFHSNEDDELRVYFSGYLPKDIWHRDTRNKIEFFFFSATNVFELLDIDSASISDGHTKNLPALSEFIADNSTALFRAFSIENKAKTFAALMTMKGNENEMVKSVRNKIRGLAE